MIKNSFIRCVFILGLALITTNCSFLTLNSQYTPDPEGEWQHLGNSELLGTFGASGKSMYYIYSCNDQDIIVTPLWDGLFALVGVPLVPFFPVSSNRDLASVYVYLHNTSEETQLNNRSISIYIPQNQKKVLAEKFNELENRENVTYSAYEFVFNIKSYDVNQLQLVLEVNSINCKIPYLNYSNKEFIAYIPISITMDPASPITIIDHFIKEKRK